MICTAHRVTGEWRKLHIEELNDLYCSPNIVRVIKSKRMRWAGLVECMGERKGINRISVGKSDGERILGKPRRRWEDNIKIDLQEVGCGLWTVSISGKSQRLLSPAIGTLSTLSRFSLFSLVQDSSEHCGLAGARVTQSVACIVKILLCNLRATSKISQQQWRTEGGVWGVQTPPKF